jgi:hypothetical protein
VCSAQLSTLCVFSLSIKEKTFWRHSSDNKRKISVEIEIYHVLSLAAAALFPCALFLSPASASDGFDLRRRRLWSARRFLQLFLASSNSSRRWNLSDKDGRWKREKELKQGQYENMHTHEIPTNHSKVIYAVYISFIYCSRTIYMWLTSTTYIYI